MTATIGISDPSVLLRATEFGFRFRECGKYQNELAVEAKMLSFSSHQSMRYPTFLISLRCFGADS